ncbi:hybrid sensor histidine kinase/response regulator [Flavobacterium sp. 7A]|uniref:ATP-binding response regulator n=1 Tax=Flavobacterium sp. 7A TaxID=2940571 RepID=UPI002226FB41|nr:hybrid sensor histidine kinase/response regulator [Flavobacterium sp. 7A]MCW2121169.1 signal transduction histidine kinase/DNA-binding response OmpR family regulator [Flavobacterium sp. 7A]
MGHKQSNLPLKVLISYFVLAALVVSVGWVLYSENVFYSKIENQSASENTIVLRISKLFSNVYKTESLARKTIQSNTEADFKNYIAQTDSLEIRIDSLKKGITNEYQIKLLDSVSVLLNEKTENIRKLKAIKSKSSDDGSVTNAIKELTQLESSLQKLQLHDFTKHPEKMGGYERTVLQNYVDYLNKNIPDDSTNTLTKKASDSILSASKRLLYRVKVEAEKKQKSLSQEENKLLKNEILISEQLRKVLRVIENEMIVFSINNNIEKDKSLKKTNKIVSYAAGIGLLLTLFFSLLITSDFSKSQSYKTQLEVANFKTKNLLKSREQLISTVSHDLKTPLSTIMGYAELLGESDLTKKQLYYTNTIKNSSDYITRLVQDLLDFSQIEAGKISIENQPFLVGETINEVANNIQSVHKDKKIDLEVTIDNRFERSVLGDVFRVKQVLINILGNAYKFTADGFIRINATLSLDEQWVYITITDSGIGIEKQSQELVFEEFAQANENIEKQFGGTGLGLAISKKISNLLGGDLYLKTSSENGSCFEIKFPLFFGSELPKSIVGLYVPVVQNKTIVIVDDDADLLGLSTEVLKKYYTVVPFSNGYAALHYILNTTFDLLITDIQMPIMNGFELAEAIVNAETSEYDGQPLIAVTGRGDLNAEVYLLAGFTTVVKKPLSPNFLLKTIDAVFLRDKLPVEVTDVLVLEKSTQLFSLESLLLFLNNDKEAVRSVVHSLMESTTDNLGQLQIAAQDIDPVKMQAIAHKMAPMFKQIEAIEIATVLNALELNQYKVGELEKVIVDLQIKINVLFSALKKVL